MGRCALALGLFCASVAQADGSVSGTVRFAVADGGASTDAEGAVVWLSGFSQPAPDEVPRIAQKGKKFHPEVLPVVVGQAVDFPNQDEILHNVFSTSRARPFDLGKFRRGESRRVQFAQTGVVDVYCDIHETMAATVLVLPNRAFARTDAQGRFRVARVPPGRWTLRAWHRRGSPVSVEVVVEDGKEVSADLSMAATTVGPHLDKYGRPYRKKASYDSQ